MHNIYKKKHTFCICQMMKLVRVPMPPSVFKTLRNSKLFGYRGTPCIREIARIRFAQPKLKT